MPKDNGKVIVSLLAGATAGIVAGLLLAPETGEEARKGIRESAKGLWGSGFGKMAQDMLAKLQGTGTSSATADSEDKNAADALFDSMGGAEPGDLATPAGNGHSVAGEQGSDYAASHRDDYSADDEAGETPRRTGVGS